MTVALAPLDVILLPNLKKHMTGTHFTTDHAIMTAAEAYLNMYAGKKTFKVDMMSL